MIKDIIGTRNKSLLYRHEIRQPREVAEPTINLQLLRAYQYPRPRLKHMLRCVKHTVVWRAHLNVVQTRL